MISPKPNVFSLSYPSLSDRGEKISRKTFHFNFLNQNHLYRTGTKARALKLSHFFYQTSFIWTFFCLTFVKISVISHLILVPSEIVTRHDCDETLAHFTRNNNILPHRLQHEEAIIKMKLTICCPHNCLPIPHQLAGFFELGFSANLSCVLTPPSELQYVTMVLE